MSTGYLLIANAGAGSADVEKLRRARRVLQQSGGVELRETSSSDELDEALADVGGRVLVVAGGDGSLHAAANALHRSNSLVDTTVGLIPLGTGNDLARTTGIPLDPVAAAGVVVRGSARAHDVLLGSDGTVTINAVHLGIGAEAVRLGAAPKKLLGPIGYPVGAAVAGARFPGWQLNVVVDGHPQPREGRVLMVGVSLGRTIGGGAPLAPDADVGDGLADITVASATGMIRRVRFAARLRHGRHRELRDVHTSRGKQIDVSGDAVRANSDGELVGPRAQWCWSVVPRAWRLISPQES
ncbi:MAG TPA: diacylglycerol kinase family protein [Actinomycetes bacterium]|nr:diacylglycerol kinase family protein [Actinomycetes bacterium]